MSINANRYSKTNLQIEFPLSESVPKKAGRGQVEILESSTGHDVATIRFLGSIEYANARYSTGAPVKIFWSNRYGESQFLGYVHHLRPNFMNDQIATDIICIGASFSLLGINQRTFQDVTADSVVKQLAQENYFQAITEPHPRIYKTLHQGGVSDWSMLRRLSKETGYVLNCDGTTIYFVSRDSYRNYYKPMSQSFYYARGGPAAHRVSDVFEFKPVVGDYVPEVGAANLVRSVTSIDPSTGSTFQVKGNLDTGASKRAVFSAPTMKIAGTPAEAEAILKGRLEENRFVYRATATVVGSPIAAPERLIYLVGVPDPYGGYWTVINVRHVIKSTNNYLMELDLGSDSLMGSVDPPPNKSLSPEKQGSPIIRVANRDLSNPLSVKKSESEINARQVVKGYTGKALEYARWYAKTM